MADSPFTRSSRAAVTAVVRAHTSSISDSRAAALAVVGFPADFIYDTRGAVGVVVKPYLSTQASRAAAVVVALGEPEDPTVKVWSFTLDGHDFFGIRLATETLVYDFSTESWAVWGSGYDAQWAGMTVLPWQASLPMEEQYGSRVLVGDSLTGTLYFMAPEEAADDYFLFTGNEGDRPFRRVVYGQITLRGRDYVPLNGVEITGSTGHLLRDASDVVTLSSSDDAGKTFNSHGGLKVEPENPYMRLDWYSLGSMTAPGRLIKIEDYGALVRIDGMDTPDGQAED